MSENRKSFWSSVPGLVTGVAGLLTGIVGLVTVLIQLDVIGADKADTAATGVPAVTTTAAVSSQSTSTTEAGTFVLSPKVLNFGPTDAKVKSVTVTNTGASTITLRPPVVVGDDAAQFQAAFDTCTPGPLTASVRCTLKVTFTPTNVLRPYRATLRLQPASGAANGDEVQLTATTLLGG